MADCFINRSNISTQNIKSIAVDATTDNNGFFVTTLPTATTRIIKVLSLTYAVVADAFVLDDRDTWGLMFYDIARNTIAVKNRNVSLIIYYIDES